MSSLSSDASSARLQPGDAAPLFSLLDAQGATVSLSDFAGQSVILYFYPQAATPGCTRQACDFRDDLSAFTHAGFVVLGVSPDSPEKLARFSDVESLSFPLLSDPEHEVALAYGAWGEKKNYGKVYEGLIRSTFVIDPQGLIKHALYNVKATGHVARLRKELEL